ncbi:DUF2867 domain-containing protein [Kribbella shirazensis]|uniref:DUF2867 domain-containing protein n=1 Tax=Kribbella shirazensis TaxID=1105143 RepID=A0A7X6A1N5_9ACTN|nr:DUF2867 domain-containing protein [Kribbella shirazensis]NIK58401.1 hypothetical protein [Kribbella shirazensis]
MRIPKSEHLARPWRIHEITQDFTLEDVWALPAAGGPDDLRLFVADVTGSTDPSANWAWPARMLWAIRWKLGELFGWDNPEHGLKARVPTLRDRLPDDLRSGPSGPEFVGLPFSPLYQLQDEWAAEMANRTVHGVMHIGWVPDGEGRYHAEMAVLVRPNGFFGRLYMSGIAPFRYWIVYPQLMRAMEREWHAVEGRVRAVR